MEICEEKRCFGCGACAASCPFRAITMQQDEEGFLRPSVSEKDCKSCDLCRRICPANREARDELHDMKRLYCFKHDSNEIRKASSSGGAFSAFAEAVLEENGKVYGAALSEDLTRVSHVSCEDEKALSRLRGSKYVQSDMSMCYSSIADDLFKGKTVLFTGTACQVFALKCAMQHRKAPMDKLLTCDIICHGVASPMVFEEFVGYLQTRAKGKLREYRFRDKAVSWRGGSSTAYLTDGTCLANTPPVASYMNVYYSGCITRFCCYSCPFARPERVSDATIGDFWGIERVLPEAEDALGVSVVLANTQRAVDILAARPAAQPLNVPISVLKQPNLHHPTKSPEKRGEFWQSYRKKGITYVLHLYGGFGLRHKMRAYGTAFKKRFMKK